MNKYEPIPTVYRGQHFPSKLEAQHATFLDSLNLKWVYEPSRLLLPDGVEYFPDFYLPEIKTWYEVRGRSEFSKPMALWKAVSPTGQTVVIGRPKGILEVPYESETATFSLDGAAISCSSCKRFWFANLNDPSACECPHCGDLTGGTESLAPNRAAAEAGLKVCWSSCFDWYQQLKHLSPSNQNIINF
jgi:hypothetical protein